MGYIKPQIGLLLESKLRQKDPLPPSSDYLLDSNYRNYELWERIALLCFRGNLQDALNILYSSRENFITPTYAGRAVLQPSPQFMYALTPDSEKPEGVPVERKLTDVVCTTPVTLEVTEFVNEPPPMKNVQLALFEGIPPQKVVTKQGRKR